jgi:hypothetical protein
MAKIISASIDLSKIDKSKVQTVDKNGKPFKNGAKYLNVSITINDEADQYGNHASIKVNQTKDERDRGEATVYLGNGKIVWQSDVPSNTPRVDNSASMAEDDLPF